MIIPLDTPYKVLRLLSKIHNDGHAKEKYMSDKFIIHLKDRGYIRSVSGKLLSSQKFSELYVQTISPTYSRIRQFIANHELQILEGYYLMSDFEGLISVYKDKKNILDNELSLQQIFSIYFNGSKHSATTSNLSVALKNILSVSEFPEEGKNRQFLSILYPYEKSRYVILCENMNRLMMPRHKFIEFWYAGGSNTAQMQFVPQPVVPIFYLFDWDHNGISIYLHIKKKYFPSLKTFIPKNWQTLKEKQENVKRHFSKWSNKSYAMLEYLSTAEKRIVDELIEEESIIEEQKLLLSNENFAENGIQ